jgi:hypothetical protein
MQVPYTYITYKILKFTIKTSVYLLLHVSVQKNEMGWACGAYGGGERCAQGVGGEA